MESVLRVVREFAVKIKVAPNEGLDSVYPEECRPTTVEVRLGDGATLAKRIEYPRGEPGNPLTDDELLEKLAI